MSETDVKAGVAPEAPQPDESKPGLSEAFGAVMDETVKFFDALGRALVTTAQDVSSLMVIKVDAETREHLDLLVDAGVAESRGKAAVQLMKEGMASKEAVFERIRRTQAQIAELRKQVRALVEV